MSTKHRVRVAFSAKNRNSSDREKIVHQGKVSELNLNGKQCLALDMPHKTENTTNSFVLEAMLSIQEIFAPYIGKYISITIEKRQGKIHQIIVTEEKEAI